MLAVTDYGGHGPDLLLLHGVGGSSHDWADVATHLTENYSVMAVDLPGHGQSPAPEQWTFPETLAELAQLKLAKPVVAGMSLGGMLAVHWGALHPECPGVVSFDGHRSPITATRNYRGLSEERTIDLRAQLKATFDAMLSMFPAQRTMFDQIAHEMAADDVVPLLADTLTSTTMVVSALDLPGTEMHHELMGAFRAGLNMDLAYAARTNDRIAVMTLPTTHAMHLEAPVRMAEIIRRPTT